MHLAAPDSVRLLDMLLEHGADINAKNSYGRTPLMNIMYQLRREFEQSLDKSC